MLQIRLLGQFDLRLDKKRVTIPSRVGQSLFAYLALTAGTSHRREKLAGIFWPDTQEETARKHLRQELWRVRKTLSAQHNGAGDYLLADEFTIAFNRSSDYWLDVAHLERQNADLDSLAASLSVYQGELLPGFYEDWILLERERIQSIFNAKMGQLLDRLVASERWAAVQEQGERWLALGNTPEAAFRALMLAHGALGDMVQVSTIYQRCISELNEKFGIEPSAETRALYDGLLRGAHLPSRPAAQLTGRVTFLFTDIEESTRLLETLGEQYAAVLEKHHEILRSTIQKWSGREVDSQGDGFFAVFPRALEAVQCAAEAQQAFHSQVWIKNTAVRVRMGLHTGEPLIASIGYVGMDVHQAARICDAAHGEQVLLSQSTREAVLYDLPGTLTLRDLGEHRLSGLKFPIPIYQLVVEGLPSDFPSIRTRLSGTEAPTPGDPPFKGLHYFDESDVDLFFGREKLTARLVERLCEGQPLSVIIGASGSGKSSLVRAGVIPALKAGKPLVDGIRPPEGSVDWRIHIITPTAHPLEALATELTRDTESVTAAATLMDDLSQDPRSLALFCARRREKRHTLLVIDQFEELFTLCRDEFEREAFIDNLLTAIATGENRITLMLTLRADFYAHLAHYPELRDAVAQHQEYIGPMTSEELRRAIEEPARRAHWNFAPGLVDLILRDVGDEPGALPLLSHALLETWKRRSGHTLTLKGYADAGGVHGAIAHTAEGVYEILSDEEKAIARDIFLRLTELGDGTEDTRRRASLKELMSHVEEPEEVRAVLNRLADARLLTLAEESAEVAHEALIREWPTLREWLNQDREGLRLHRRLTEAASEWELLERDPGALYRGVQLAQAGEWAASRPQALNAGERVFLNASIEQEQIEEWEREEQQKRELAAAQRLAETERARAEEQTRSANRLRMRNRVITSVGILSLLLALLAGVFSVRSSQSQRQAQIAEAQAELLRDNALLAQAAAQAEGERAENEKRLAISRELAIASVNNLDVNPERSILLALHALSQSDTPEARDALHRALQAFRVELSVQHDDIVEDVAYSPDGTRLATASDDGTARVWDAATGEELLNLETGPSASVAFSPNGKLLATADYEARTVSLWDAVSGEKLLTLAGHSAGVNHIAFSPDGAQIASAGEDKSVKIWDVATGQLLLTLTGHKDIVSSVAFSPDGTELATGSWDHSVKVWDARTGVELLSFSEYSEPAEAAFSPDGTRLVISFGEGAEVRELSTGGQLFTVSGHTSLVERVLFSPDGEQIATVSIDGTVKLWSAQSGTELMTLAGHTSSVFSAAFSPDGTYLVTASGDGTARVWNISPAGSREWLTISRPGYELRQVIYSPDGRRLAAASFDGTARIFDAEQGRELLTLSGHTARVWSVAFNSDGSRLATTSEDNTAKIWDAWTGQELLTLSGHGKGIVGGFFPGVLAA
ncbi:MAG TPA: BTAD domain-containing putative transcriptional regulator, partial [Anaerolineales bacterium]|nr:BTAD domain-containing putative transcriptional regulator [Anaerolineales bacterium]